MDEDAPLPTRGTTRREHELALLVESVRDYAILLLDGDGIITTWNIGAERLKGYTAQQIIGRHVSTFYTEEDRARDHPAEMLATARRDGRAEDEGWRVRRDGTRFWASVTITVVRDIEGTLIGFGKVTRDLTERRAAEEALRRANERLALTNQELDRFAAVAAHDLQEPLRTVAGFSGLLDTRHAGALDETGRGYLGHITAAVGRMERLVDDLLGYARAAEPLARRGETVVLADVVVGVLGDLRATIDARAAEVEVDITPAARVQAAVRDVEAVLRNLLSNAVKFAAAEGPRVLVRAGFEGGVVRVEVIDNGIGIDSADRPRLFIPFQRLQSAADYQGTGLGLAIAQRVVERNGGAIGVDSTAGEGSRFWFTLPAA